MPVDQSGEYIFKWKLLNYSCCNKAKGERILSPMFEIEELNGSQWYIEVYPNGDKIIRKDENFVSCYLTRIKPFGNIETIIDYRFEILDDKDCVVKSFAAKNIVFTKENRSFGYARLFDLDALTNWTQDAFTLVCRIKSDLLKKVKLTGSEVLTTIGVYRSSCAWDIRFPVMSMYSECITFSILKICQFDVTLSYLLEGVDIIIHLKEHESELPLKITFGFMIFDKIGCKLNSKRAAILFDSVDKVKFPDCITKKHLQACKTDKDAYELKLKCNASIFNGSYYSSFVQHFSFTPSLCSNAKPVTRFASALNDDFQNIFVSKKNSDLKIRAENEVILAHKFVLRVRSPVFDAMFDQNMLENRTGVVEITDMDGKTLQGFLKFLYTGTVDIVDFESVKKLIIAADKYQVPSLVDECAILMKSVVSVENVCEIIAIADLINCESLKSNALNFIRVNAAKVLSSPVWSRWIEGNIKLATYILSKLSADICQGYK